MTRDVALAHIMQVTPDDGTWRANPITNVMLSDACFAFNQLTSDNDIEELYCFPSSSQRQRHEEVFLRNAGTGVQD